MAAPPAGPPGPDSLDELLQAVRRGDDRAREALYERFLPRLRRWASRRLPAYARDLVDTDDLTQDVMVQTLGKLEELERYGMVSYLRRALLNRIRDELRRVGRKPPPDPVSFDRTVADEPSPLELAIGAEAAERYEKALETLSTREREAVLLRLEMGFSYQEIAEALDWNSANSARMAVTRAVKRLAVELGHPDG
jgi:RNA polymerase sigma-70 factor (ECF subfamily)